jgi:hypothetical protein
MMLIFQKTRLLAGVFKHFLPKTRAKWRVCHHYFVAGAGASTAINATSDNPALFLINALVASEAPNLSRASLLAKLSNATRL